MRKVGQVIEVKIAILTNLSLLVQTSKLKSFIPISK